MHGVKSVNCPVNDTAMVLSIVASSISYWKWILAFVFVKIATSIYEPMQNIILRQVGLHWRGNLASWQTTFRLALFS